MNNDIPSVRKDGRPNRRSSSIWDDDVDFEKVQELPPSMKHELFPNDYAPNGEPYGDF